MQIEKPTEAWCLHKNFPVHKTPISSSATQHAPKTLCPHLSTVSSRQVGHFDQVKHPIRALICLIMQCFRRGLMSWFVCFCFYRHALLRHLLSQPRPPQGHCQFERVLQSAEYIIGRLFRAWGAIPVCFAVISATSYLKEWNRSN